MVYDSEEFDPLVEADIQFGGFKTVNSFEGNICDISLSFFTLLPNDIANIFNEGRKELDKIQSPTTSRELYLKSQERIAKRLHAKRKSIPWELIDNLAMHSRVSQSKENAIVEEEVHPLKLLRKYFDEHEGIEERCKFLYKLIR